MAEINSMTVKQLYENPPGSGTGNVAARYRIRDSLQASFVKLVKEHKFRARILYDEKQKVKYFVIGVPSESLKKDYFFTVVLKVSDAVNSYISFINSPVKVASNNPAFVYTGYAYITSQNGFFIEELRPRFDKKAFTPPKTRNPQEIMGFDKSIWFAISYIIAYELYKIQDYEKFSLKLLFEYFDDFDDSLVMYSATKKKQEEDEKKEKEKAKNNSTKKAPSKHEVRHMKSSTIKTIKTTKTVRTIKAK